MKRIMLLFLCCALLACPALASALTVDAPLTGVVCWPDGTDETSAAYVYRYEYPAFTGDEAAQTINAHFTYLVDDAKAFAIPMATVGLNPDADRIVTDITTEITCMTDDYLSVLITTAYTMNGYARTVVAAHTFTLKGDMAGSATNLPRYLGLLDDGETDEWLRTRQTEKADGVIRGIIWQKIAAMQTEGEVPLYDDLNEDVLEYAFYPEEDFYLDANGEPVFFLLPGVIAPDDAGTILFPITREEIDDEM